MISYRPFSHMLGSGGNDTTTGMAIDGSAATGTPTEFYVSPGSSAVWDVYHLSIEMLDTKNFQAETFGVGAALTNGLLLYVKDADGTVVHYITPSAHGIKANSDMAFFAETANTKQFTMTTNESATFHIDFIARFGQPLRLNAGWKLCAYLSDDASGLLELEMLATGLNLSRID